MRENVRKPIRIDRHDYTSEGIYFITICTEGRQYLLAEKIEDQIRFTPIGKLAKESWEKIALPYEGISLSDFVIMPNHIHGIIIFNQAQTEGKIASLFDIIRNYKSYTTHEYYKDKVRSTGNLWQRGYFERVVRYAEMDKVREYIFKNPADWEYDEFYKVESLYKQSM